MSEVEVRYALNYLAPGRAQHAWRNHGHFTTREEAEAEYNRIALNENEDENWTGYRIRIVMVVRTVLRQTKVGEKIEVVES